MGQLPNHSLIRVAEMRKEACFQRFMVHGSAGYNLSANRPASTRPHYVIIFDSRREKATIDLMTDIHFLG